jgi:hypothetical protein
VRRAKSESVSIVIRRDGPHSLRMMHSLHDVCARSAQKNTRKQGDEMDGAVNVYASPVFGLRFSIGV